MTLKLSNEQILDLHPILDRPIEDIVEICKVSYDFLINGENAELLGHLAKKYESTAQKILRTVEALISVLIDCTTKLNSNEIDLKNVDHLKPEVVDVLNQFLKSKRHFIESSIKSANLRNHRIVNIEWRLETKFASRCLHKQSNVIVVMKLYLHTEPKNENRDLLPEGESDIHPEERRNRKDILVQTDIPSLMHMIQTLEDALIESRTRRIRNIVNAIH